MAGTAIAKQAFRRFRPFQSGAGLSVGANDLLSDPCRLARQVKQFGG